jgi:hypothetical protein
MSRYRAEGRLDQIPPVLFLESPLDRLTDEAAATAGTGRSVYTSEEFVIEFYVHTHV